MGNAFYNGVRRILRVYFAIVHPIKIMNPENVPDCEGPTIVCCNHISLRDPFVLAMCVKKQLRFMAKKELFDNPILKPPLEAVGAFPVDRGNSDTAAIRTALNVLAQGETFGIFPEGTRNDAGEEEHTVKSGVALIALRSKSTVVPVYIDGPYRVFRPIRVYFGKSLSYRDHEGRVDRAAIDRATAEISNGIWSLKPALPAGK